MAHNIHVELYFHYYYFILFYFWYHKIQYFCVYIRDRSNFNDLFWYPDWPRNIMMYNLILFM